MAQLRGSQRAESEALRVRPKRSTTAVRAGIHQALDGIVSVLQVDHPELDLHALSMSGIDSVWVEYFFNASNHAVGTKPPSYMTYHFYGEPLPLNSLEPICECDGCHVFETNMA